MYLVISRVFESYLFTSQGKSTVLRKFSIQYLRVRDFRFVNEGHIRLFKKENLQDSRKIFNRCFYYNQRSLPNSQKPSVLNKHISKQNAKDLMQGCHHKTTSSIFLMDFHQVLFPFKFSISRIGNMTQTDKNLIQSLQ